MLRSLRVSHGGQILGRVVDGHVELRFETDDGKVARCVLNPEDFEAFCGAMASLAEELWPVRVESAD